MLRISKPTDLEIPQGRDVSALRAPLEQEGSDPQHQRDEAHSAGCVRVLREGQLHMRSVSRVKSSNAEKLSTCKYIHSGLKWSSIYRVYQQVCMFKSSCPADMPILPISHRPKTKVNSPHVRDLSNHPVIYSIERFFRTCHPWSSFNAT